MDNIALSIDTPDGSCAIGRLPTSTDGGLELAQAVFTLETGDDISLTANSPSGGVMGACRVTDDALTHPINGIPNSIFIDIFITQGLIICSSGVEPTG
ncbi:MAG: hypothetical protein HKN17_05790 [Rhodothermales bacterium]|nr:hypothetical protein [Rhodothermales bacterium]